MVSFFFVLAGGGRELLRSTSVVYSEIHHFCLNDWGIDDADKESYVYIVGLDNSRSFFSLALALRFLPCLKIPW